MIHIHKKRNPIREPAVGAKAQPKEKANVRRLPIWRTWKANMKKGIGNNIRTALTQVRPYISDRGPKKRGYCQGCQQKVEDKGEYH